LIGMPRAMAGDFCDAGGIATTVDAPFGAPEASAILRLLFTFLPIGAAGLADKARSARGTTPGLPFLLATFPYSHLCCSPFGSPSAFAPLAAQWARKEKLPARKRGSVCVSTRRRDIVR